MLEQLEGVKEWGALYLPMASGKSTPQRREMLNKAVPRTKILLQ
jgi:hypothetical protein